MYAYILVNLNEMHEENVLDYFTDMDEVEERHILFGEWYLILKIKMESPEAAASFVIEKVRSHEDVELTSTLIVAR